MKLTRYSVIALGLSSVVGCQTISQSNTPYMYKMKEALTTGVSTFCIKTDASGVSVGGEKVKSGNQIYNLEIASDMSGWVRARAKNTMKRVEGMFYYNSKLNEHRCSGFKIPDGLPKSWRSISEYEAQLIINGDALPPSEVFAKPTAAPKPKLY